jgi:hypothetical protein
MRSHTREPAAATKAWLRALRLALQVPFFVRGPGVTPGVLDTVMVNNVDLGATFLEVWASVCVFAHVCAVPARVCRRGACSEGLLGAPTCVHPTRDCRYGCRWVCLRPPPCRLSLTPVWVWTVGNRS